MKEWFYPVALALACQRRGELFRQLCVRFGSAKGVLAAPHEDVSRVAGLLLANKIKDPTLLAEAAKEAEQIDRLGASVVVLGDPLYPASLASIDDPAPVLFIKGQLPQKKTIIAIVGARRSDEYGLQQAERLAHQLARRGAVVVSGGASGVDTAAHKGALAGGGQTLVVLGSGLAEVFPKENAALFTQAHQHGALISELPSMTPAKPEHFPKRNRLIAGLAESVIVVRGELKSGAMHTVKAAREQGKRLFAVPGRADEALSALPHQLLREGALLCESADDVLSLQNREQLPLFESPAFVGDAKIVFDALQREAEPIDVLVAKTSIPVFRVSAALLELELAGACAVYPGGRYARKPR